MIAEFQFFWFTCQTFDGTCDLVRLVAVPEVIFSALAVTLTSCMG